MCPTQALVDSGGSEVAAVDGHSQALSHSPLGPWWSQECDSPHHYTLQVRSVEHWGTDRLPLGKGARLEQQSLVRGYPGGRGGVGFLEEEEAGAHEKGKEGGCEGEGSSPCTPLSLVPQQLHHGMLAGSQALGILAFIFMGSSDQFHRCGD